MCCCCRDIICKISRYTIVYCSVCIYNYIYIYIVILYTYMKVSRSGGYPSIIHSSRIFHSKPTILGIPPLRKLPHICTYYTNMIKYVHIIVYTYVNIFIQNMMYTLFSHAAGSSQPFSTLSAKNAFETSWRIPAAEWQHRRSPEHFRERRSYLSGSVGNLRIVGYLADNTY